MKKALLILTALLAIACIVALPVLCTHSDILPEVSTAYYDYKAKEEALTATGPEAELMRMLTGLSADTKLEPVRTPIRFSWFGLYLAIGTFIAICALLSNKQHDLRSALLWTSALAVPFGLIGARLVYALVNIPFYLNAISAPEAMLKVWEGGLSLRVKYVVYVAYQLLLVTAVSFLAQWIADGLPIILPAAQPYAKLAAKVMITPLTMIMNFFVLKQITEKW